MSERLVLALDTCFGPVGAALATDEGRLLGKRCAQNPAGRQAETLPGVVEDLFRETGASYQQLSRIVVTVGPGAFTGVRVGLAFAKGLKIATAAQVLGISSLECLAFQYRQNGRLRAVAVVVDARRSEAYVYAMDASGTCVVRPCVVPVTELDACLDLSIRAEFDAVGSGRDLITTAGVTKPEPNIEVIDVALLAQRGGQLIAQDYPGAPIYLREPDARLPG